MYLVSFGLLIGFEVGTRVTVGVIFFSQKECLFDVWFCVMWARNGCGSLSQSLRARQQKKKYNGPPVYAHTDTDIDIVKDFEKKPKDVTSTEP